MLNRGVAISLLAKCIPVSFSSNTLKRGSFTFFSVSVVQENRHIIQKKKMKVIILQDMPFAAAYCLDPEQEAGLI